MLAAERLDFVDIATTVASHRPLVELAAGAGVAHGLPEALRGVDGGRAGDGGGGGGGRAGADGARELPLAVGDPARAKAEMAAIGRPFWGRVSFRSGFDVYAAQPYLATDERFIIQDLGIHILDVARFLFGDVATLAATTQRVNPRDPRRGRGDDAAGARERGDERRRLQLREPAAAGEFSRDAARDRGRPRGACGSTRAIA